MNSLVLTPSGPPAPMAERSQGALSFEDNSKTPFFSNPFIKIGKFARKATPPSGGHPQLGVPETGYPKGGYPQRVIPKMAKNKLGRGKQPASLPCFGPAARQNLFSPSTAAFLCGVPSTLPQKFPVTHPPHTPFLFWRIHMTNIWGGGEVRESVCFSTHTCPLSG